MLCNQYLVLLGLACEKRGMGALYILIPGLKGVALPGAVRLSHCPAAH